MKRINSALLEEPEKLRHDLIDLIINSTLNKEKEYDKDEISKRVEWYFHQIENQGKMLRSEEKTIRYTPDIHQLVLLFTQILLAHIENSENSASFLCHL